MPKPSREQQERQKTAISPLLILRYWLEGYEAGEPGRDREIKNPSLARAYLLGIEKRRNDERQRTNQNRAYENR